MHWYSMLAIYAIMWFLCLFVVLPFHARGDGRDATRVAGQADSAPPNIRPWRIVAQTSVVTLALFALYFGNYTYGWVTLRDIDLTPAEFRHP